MLNLDIFVIYLKFVIKMSLVTVFWDILAIYKITFDLKKTWKW